MIKEVVVTPYFSRAIDILRGLASLGVIWGHSMYGLSLPIELNGAFWVWIFLPIRGYLVGRGFLSGRYSMTPSGFFQFLFNRALRIIPLAYLALFIGLAVHLAYDESNSQIFRQFLFVAANNDMSLVGALWTIAVELHFYLAAIILAPLVFLVWRNFHWTFTGLSFFVFVLIGCDWIQRVGDVPIQPRTFLGNIAFFIFGLFLACVKSVGIRRANELKSVLILGLLATGWWLQNYQIQYFWASGDRIFLLAVGRLLH